MNMANTALTAAARNAVAAAIEPFRGRLYRQGFIGRGGRNVFYSKRSCALKNCASTRKISPVKHFAAA
jgi:hypothetical protein